MNWHGIIQLWYLDIPYLYSKVQSHLALFANFCEQNPVKHAQEFLVREKNWCSTDVPSDLSWSHKFTALTNRKLLGLTLTSTLGVDRLSVPILSIFMIIVLVIFTPDIYIDSKYRLAVILVCNNRYRIGPEKHISVDPYSTLLKMDLFCSRNFANVTAPLEYRWIYDRIAWCCLFFRVEGGDDVVAIRRA